MNKRTISLGLAMGLIAVAGCNKADDRQAEQGTEAVKKAGDTTIAKGLDQNSRFFQAAKAAGIDTTLAGPGPYTVLVADDAAFAKLPAGTWDNWQKPEGRQELTRVLTYHILPGTVLAADIGKAIDDGKGKAQLATMGGGTLTATKEGDSIIFTDGAGGKARITGAEEVRANGVVHHIDSVLMPAKAA